MNINETVQKTVDSGALPLTLSYEKVTLFESKKVILRSRLNINSLELGTLTPKQYKVVAGRSKQGGELLQRQMQKVFEEFPKAKKKHSELECITIPILSRTLLEGAAAKIIFEEFERNATVPPSFICFEISSDVLYEDMESVKARFSELYDLKIRIAISELGDEFCPIFRLSNLTYDYAFADAYALKELCEDNDIAKGLPEHVHTNRAKAIAPELKEGEESFAKSAGYDGFSLDTDREKVEEVKGDEN